MPATLKPSPINIEHMLMLSTGHVDENVAFVFNNEENAQSLFKADHWITYLVMYPKAEYGWLLYVHDAVLTEEKVIHLPKCLVDCIQLAQSHGCRWIMFDRDEDPIDVLPTYDW